MHMIFISPTFNKNKITNDYVLSVLSEEVETLLSIITALQACMILTMLGFVLGMVLMLVVMFRGSMKEARRHVLGWLCLITWVLTGRYILVDLIDPIITTITTYSDTRTHARTYTNTNKQTHTNISCFLRV